MATSYTIQIYAFDKTTNAVMQKRKILAIHTYLKVIQKYDTKYRNIKKETK